jgi:hypothetical protein
MGWIDRFKPWSGDVYRPGECLPEPQHQTATGRKLYTVQQIRAAYAQGAKDSRSLLVKAAKALPSAEQLKTEIAEHLNGLEGCEAWTEREKRLFREQLRRGL